MAITSLTEFDESTAFERLVLDSLRPVFSTDASEILDLRESMAGTGPIQISLSFACSISDQAVDEVRRSVMPLLFGGAWKILDLMFELALHQAPIKSSQNTRYIATKIKSANNAEGNCIISSVDQPLWAALCAVYAATAEHRHCLVHRQATFSEQPLRLAGQTKYGVPLKTLEASELEAFVAAAQIAASAMIAGALDTRSADHLRYELDRLQKHTGVALLGGLKACKPVTLKVALQPLSCNNFEIDFAQAHAMAIQRMPTAYFDMWIDVPDGTGRTLFARLEDVPKIKTMIDLGALPPYLMFR